MGKRLISLILCVLIFSGCATAPPARENREFQESVNKQFGVLGAPPPSLPEPLK